MCTIVNTDFGFDMKLNSVFIAINIDFDCVAKPNSRFNFVNTDFGCAGGDRRARARARARPQPAFRSRPAPRCGVNLPVSYLAARIAANMPHAEFSSRPTLYRRISGTPSTCKRARKSVNSSAESRV